MSNCALKYLLKSIGLAGSFSGGGQPLRPAKIQSFPAKKFSCQGGPSSSTMSCQAAMPSYSAKLFCQWAKMADKWLKNWQKWRKSWNMWQKATKNGRKQIKMIRKLAKCCFSTLFTAKIFFSVLPSSHICPAKLPFLSCQALISVLPS